MASYMLNQSALLVGFDDLFATFGRRQTFAVKACATLLHRCGGLDAFNGTDLGKAFPANDELGRNTLARPGLFMNRHVERIASLTILSTSEVEATKASVALIPGTLNTLLGSLV